MPMQPRVAPPKKRSGSIPCGKMNDAERVWKRILLAP